VKLIDRYMFRGFAYSFLVVFVSMVGLAIMVDMVLNIDEFTKKGTGGELGPTGWTLVGHIGRHYFFRMFEYFQWLCGAAMLVGGAFAVARLNKHNELVAFKASGISAYRLLAPVIVTGVFVSVFYVLNQELIIPRIIDHLVTKRSAARSGSGGEVQFVRDGSNALFKAPRYVARDKAMEATITRDASGKVIRRVPVQIVVRGPKNETLLIISADRAVYDKHQKAWILEGGTQWEATVKTRDDEGRPMHDVTPVSIFASDLTPQKLLRQQKRDSYRYLSFAQIRELLATATLSMPERCEVVMHQHFSKPILNLVILLLGLPLVVGQEGKNYFISVMVCIGLFVAALGVDFIAAEWAGGGHIAPILGAYLPVLLFTPVAIVSMDAMRT
jgi:lipopolysaccharide export system permease protein